MRVARSGLSAIDYTNGRMRGSAATHDQTKYSGILLNLRT